MEILASEVLRKFFLVALDPLLPDVGHLGVPQVLRVLRHVEELFDLVQIRLHIWLERRINFLLNKLVLVNTLEPPML